MSKRITSVLLMLAYKTNILILSAIMRYAIMKRSLRFLTLMRLWPKAEGDDSQILGCFILLSSSILLFGSLGYLVVYGKFGTNDIDAIETTTSQFGVIYFVVCFMVKRNEVIRIVDLLSDFSTFGLPRFFDERIRKLNFLLLYCIIILTIATGGVFICPIIFSQSCEKVNQEMNRTKVCGLVTNIWAPFSYSEYPMKQVVIFLESYCCFVNLGCAGFVSFIYVESMEHLIIRIEQLKDLFSDIANEDDIAIRQHKLKEWVEYHLLIFEIGKMMSDTYRYSLSVIVFCAGILFGCIGVSTMQFVESSIFISIPLLGMVPIYCYLMCDVSIFA
ncbi:uncharacterized protein LOC123012171 [Tribolium madens]|uniref:uncharacterized protein LOC123012171 n=1 Tax=Tribolium madens TaxID=41895 RepID=UPI001CF766C4|nr:uncharacterized protein LOC123012171 [Tribolium madens]